MDNAYYFDLSTFYNSLTTGKRRRANRPDHYAPFAPDPMPVYDVVASWREAPTPVKFRLLPTQPVRAVKSTTEVQRRLVHFYLNDDASRLVDFQATSMERGTPTNKTSIISKVAWFHISDLNNFYAFHKPSIPVATNRHNVEGKNHNR